MTPLETFHVRRLIEKALKPYDVRTGYGRKRHSNDSDISSVKDHNVPKIEQEYDGIFLKIVETK